MFLRRRKEAVFCLFIRSSRVVHTNALIHLIYGVCGGKAGATVYNTVVTFPIATQKAQRYSAPYKLGDRIIHYKPAR